jgi:hippurate hydrolase
MSVVATARAESLWPDLKPLYEELHAHPELSLQETSTAAKMAERLRGLGFTVATGFGTTGVGALVIAARDVLGKVR